MRLTISNGDFPMLIKTSIAMGIVVALYSNAVAVEQRQQGAENGPILINRCVPDYRDPSCNRHGSPKN
jgi:hypothetical protein